MKPTLVFDIEVYRDYFLISFMNVESGKIAHFEMFADHPLDTSRVKGIMRGARLISFNGTNYDLPLVTLALQGLNCETIKRISDKIILNNLRYWNLGIEPISCDHIDLMEVAPGRGSLKLYGSRLNAPKLQDLPIEPGQSISSDQRGSLKQYCENDLKTTALLHEALTPQLQLRERMSEQYDLDLRSKSDAQIAEAVITQEVEKSLKRRLNKPGDLSGVTFQYDPPAFIQFESEMMQSTLNTVCSSTFYINNAGRVMLPNEIKNLMINIGESTYRMGIGGLHSSEKQVSHSADEHHILVDRDVASYYPAIILNCGLKPYQMGDHFTKVYRSIVDRRLEAKRSGDTTTANSLKITINGSFGKFGSRYSRLYSPKLLIQTTLTGQLSLLMLIEMLEGEGIPVVSANTDGVVIKCPRDKEGLMEFTIWEWEERTQFDTEATYYQHLYSRDVNNYVALKDDGFKLKGAYSSASLMKNPVATISTTAAIRYLQSGDAIEETIHNCRDITQFLTTRTVKGGAVDQNGDYLGKTIRWYYTTDVDGCITYQVNGYKVPTTDGAQALMDLPEELPNNISYDWYIEKSRSILDEIGAEVEA